MMPCLPLHLLFKWCFGLVGIRGLYFWQCHPERASLCPPLPAACAAPSGTIVLTWAPLLCCCTNYRTDSSWKNNSHREGYADGQTESLCCCVSSPIPFNPVVLRAVFDLFFGSFGLNASSRTSLLEIFCYAIAARGLMQGSGEDSWSTLRVGFVVRSHVNRVIRMGEKKQKEGLVQCFPSLDTQELPGKQALGTPEGYLETVTNGIVKEQLGTGR